MSKTVASGVATFGGCTIDAVDTGHQIQAVATALAAATSTSFGTVQPPPGGLWYLAEGFTGFGWNASLHILNAGTDAANVTVTYLLDSGSPEVRYFTVQAESHLTINANDPAEGPGPDAAFGVRVTSDQAIMVEEDMYAGASGDFAHGTEATEFLSTTWFFAEGFTQFGWETFILVAVPGSDAADVTITYNVQGGSPVTSTVAVSAESRFTLVGHVDVPDGTFSVSLSSTQPIVAEMVMLDPTRLIAHRTIGVRAASTTWYLGEGFTGFGWETFISVGNPSGSDATVTVTYNIDGESPVTKIIVVPAGSRGTFIAHDTGTGVGSGKAFGAVITSDQPVVVQEVLIDPALDASRAHSTMATPILADQWTFSGGSSVTGFATFLTIANPTGADASVTATYFFNHGTGSISESLDIVAGRRGTFASTVNVPVGKDFGVVITVTGSEVIAQQIVYDELLGRAFSSSGAPGR